ncbi:Antigenic thaumatin domain-containing protein [Pyrenophora tritici-repentis]|nr:Antigenic thaumatin domain-containing protein [Pyrenophora tritici-repentis]KAF7449198.1 Antigenic thaumatin domain-containing protein [Pyrenophora tritici-repentis]KAG9383861.1 Antigenic thaumatin domain-containing protein [Pyrenophora tritici-repentis]KAI0589079.1 Antigenic thaumatin domain-containing protein [Pyrenophora tritici-repentis]KAI0591237.1 Antigenic thaumatin domain-containing protein [Pyrenophora tritici-repentis]
MQFLNILFLGLCGFLANAAPTSPNDDGLSKDWTHVFTQDNINLSTVNPGSPMASVSIPSVADATEVHGQIVNKCSFPVWVRLAIAATTSNPDRPGAKCDHAGETHMVEVQPGGTYLSPFPAKCDQCGHVLKVAHNAGDLKVYQFEYSMDGHDGRLWYDLSAENGAPFQKVERYLGTSGRSCPFVDCKPGQWGKHPVYGCDWPLQPVCNTPSTVVGVLCGRV